jgi:membrane protease subunit HflC
MKIFGTLFLIIAAAAIFALLNSFYVVRQYEQALVMLLGDPVAIRNAPGTDEAGLYFKIPFVQQVVKLERKNIGYELRDLEVLASDQRRLKVDAFARWQISDPLKFYQRLRTERVAGERIESFTEAAIRAELGKVPVPEIVSGQRTTLMNAIRTSVNAQMEPFGVDIIDVRIRQADLPVEVANGVYGRMQTARLQEAERIRAEGEERARLIRATAQRESVVIEAQAREAAERLRGEGDAKSTEIYARAYTKDVDFFRFQRALIACEKSIGAGTRIVVGPDALGICDQFIASARANGANR